MQIELGSGKVMVGGIIRREDGAQGLLLRPVDEEHFVGEKDPSWIAGDEYIIGDEDMVIWIESLASARVLQDRVNMIALELNGFSVQDKD